jgi:hypothetical protein
MRSSISRLPYKWDLMNFKANTTSIEQRIGRTIASFKWPSGHFRVPQMRSLIRLYVMQA